MKKRAKDKLKQDGHTNRITAPQDGYVARARLWLCNRKGNHSFEIVRDEWFDGNVFYGDLASAEPVPLETARRWCTRHTILRCKRCGLEYERLSGGVKGCGAHLWIAGQEWPAEYHCLPWGDPDATVRADAPLNPPPDVLWEREPSSLNVY